MSRLFSSPILNRFKIYFINWIRGIYTVSLFFFFINICQVLGLLRINNNHQKGKHGTVHIILYNLLKLKYLINRSNIGEGNGLEPNLELWLFSQKSLRPHCDAIWWRYNFIFIQKTHTKTLHLKRFTFQWENLDEFDLLLFEFRRM